MRSYSRLFRLPRFGELFGLLAAGYINVEISYLTVPALTGALTLNPLWFGGIMLAMRAPRVVFSVLAGYWSDNGSPRKVLLAANFAGALIFFLLGGLGAMGRLDLPALAVLYFFINVCGISHVVGSGAALGEIVPRGENLSAQALCEGAINFAGIVGTLIAGWAIAEMGVYRAFYLQGGLLSLIAFLSRGMPKRERAAKEKPTRFKAGLEFIFKSRTEESRRLLFSILLASWFYGCVMTIFTQAPFYLLTALKFNAKTAGTLFALVSLIVFLLTWGVKPITEKIGTGRVFLISCFCCVASLLIFSRATGPLWLVAAMSVGALGFSALRITWNHLCHLSSPQDILGGVLGVHNMFCQLAMLISTFLFAWAAKDWGYQKSYFAVGALSSIGLGIYYAGPLRGLHLHIEDGENAALSPEALEPVTGTA